MKVLIIGALPSSLVNFRGELIKSLVANGHEVVAMASGASVEDVRNIENLGLKYVDYPVQRNGINPFSDIKTLLNFKKVFKVEQPDLVLAYTIKPVIWGGIATRFFPDIQFYGLITGLGFAFQKGGFKRNVLSFIAISLYRLALSKANKAIFQNPDNLQVFIENKIISKHAAVRVNGSGVDLTRFVKNTPVTKNFTFLTIARLLGEKGLREYAAAAKIVKQQYPHVIFQLVGPEDPSPDGIPLAEVRQWHQAGDVEYLGGANDVRPYLQHCNVFVLASYHEGMPRTVLEAMAAGRPILTTNVPGCKETVINGENGFLVEKQNSNQLAEKMLWFIENQDQWPAMAEKSHELAQEHFDVRKVNEQLLNIMNLTR
ncbi:MAG: glycosyltransferase family 4 protein [Colwellia sp.]|jgi:Glycosyltransferase